MSLVVPPPVYPGSEDEEGRGDARAPVSSDETGVDTSGQRGAGDMASPTSSTNQNEAETKTITNNNNASQSKASSSDGSITMEIQEESSVTSPRQPKNDVTMSTNNNHEDDVIDTVQESNSVTSQDEDERHSPSGGYSDDSNKPPTTSAGNANPAKPPGGGDEEQVLVEHNGEFELVKVSSLTAEERELYLQNSSQYGGNSDRTASKTSINSASSAETLDSRPPRPKSSFRPNRPVTASTATQQKRNLDRHKRAQSAQEGNRNRRAAAANHETTSDFGYTSPYALSAEQKRMGEKQRRKQEENRRKAAEEEQKKKEREKEEAEDAFQVNILTSYIVFSQFFLYFPIFTEVFWCIFRLGFNKKDVKNRDTKKRTQLMKKKRG